jgi:putative glutamine amidotransferase
MKFAVSVSTNHHTAQPRDYLPQAYVPYLQTLGLIPILVPNNLTDPLAFVEALDVQGIVLTGGGDLDPARYGQPNQGTETESIALDRDETEFRLLDFATRRRLPVLGICRGFQVINVYFGGQLVQDIPSQLRSPVVHDGNPSHPVTVIDARFERVIGADHLDTNSHHHQGVTSNLLAPEVEAFAYSEADRIIEGIVHTRYPVIATQWHPEKPTPSRPSDLRLFGQFLKESAFWTKKNA